MTEPTNETLLVVDGHSLAFRAFYALPVENFSTAAGQATNAVWGFATMLYQAACLSSFDVASSKPALEPASTEFYNAETGMYVMPDGRMDEFDGDRKSTRLNSSHSDRSRMPSSA